MAKIPAVRVPRVVTTSAVHAVRAAIRDAQRLGILWRLRPGTVGGNLPAQPESVPVQLDGDSSTIYARSMVGSVVPRQRVWCVQIPPAGVYIIGIIGVSKAAPTTETITASGDYVQARGLTWVRVRLVGGGGQCGGVAATAAGQSAEGGGGGAGGYSESIISAEDLPHTTTVTIGAGGSAGGAGAAGANGGTTSFGSLLSATGGTGGGAGGATAGNNVVDGGGGGTGSSGSVINLPGGGGAAGLTLGGVAVRGNAGGASHFGQQAVTGATSTNGQIGRNYGGGGGGTRNGASQAARAGAAGAPGVVIVEEFYS